MYPFHQYWPTFWSGVLLVIHFGTPKVHFIRLEAWFYINVTLKYDKNLVFYSPMEFLFWIWLSWVPSFEGSKFVCHFYWYGPSLSDGFLHIMNFASPIVHCIWLETQFYVNITLRYDRFCSLVHKRVSIMNLALASSNFWRPQVRVPFLLVRALFIWWCIACYEFWCPNSSLYWARNIVLC